MKTFINTGYTIVFIIILLWIITMFCACSEPEICPSYQYFTYNDVINKMTVLGKTNPVSFRENECNNYFVVIFSDGYKAETDRTTKRQLCTTLQIGCN